MQMRVLSEMGNLAYNPPQRVQTAPIVLVHVSNYSSSPPQSQRVQTSFGQDWADESLSEMGNPADSPPQRVQTAPVVLVHVSNCSSSWKDLPIVMMEQQIMEAMNESIIVSGKTTQIMFGISGIFSYHSDILSFLIPG